MTRRLAKSGALAVLALTLSGLAGWAAEENDYPTFHQAAVSAAVYLLSLGLGGSGFLTVLFTDDQRAVHDIVSGTLMVKDCQEETA